MFSTINKISPNAVNGLTKSGNNIRLGGVLTGDTSINFSGNSFTLGNYENGTSIRLNNTEVENKFSKNHASDLIAATGIIITATYYGFASPNRVFAVKIEDNIVGGVRIQFVKYDTNSGSETYDVLSEKNIFTDDVETLEVGTPSSPYMIVVIPIDYVNYPYITYFSVSDFEGTPTPTWNPVSDLGSGIRDIVESLNNTPDGDFTNLTDLKTDAAMQYLLSKTNKYLINALGHNFTGSSYFQNIQINGDLIGNSNIISVTGNTIDFTSNIIDIVSTQGFLIEQPSGGGFGLIRIKSNVIGTNVNDLEVTVGGFGDEGKLLLNANGGDENLSGVEINTSYFRVIQELNDVNDGQLLFRENSDGLITKATIGYGLGISGGTLITTGGTESITANNGLTKIGDNIVLGGSLTGDTTIVGGGTYSLNFGVIDDEPINEFNVQSAANINIASYGGNISFTGNSGSFNVQANTDVNITTISGDLNTNINQNINLITQSGGINLIQSGGSSPMLLQTNAGNIELYAQTADVVIKGDNAVLISGNTGFGFVGAEYGADYSANYTSRSLVDKGYVTGLTTTSGVQTANNGLTKSGTNVYLGGTLTGDTTIDADENSLSFINLTSAAIRSTNGTFNSEITNNFSQFLIESYDDNDVSQSFIIDGENSYIDLISTKGANNSQLRIDSLNNAITIYTTSPGIEYGADYSANYTPRSLVDKGYVTGLTSSLSTTANNGLTKSGDNIRLGGTLTGNTIIDTGNNNLLFDYGKRFNTGTTTVIRSTVGTTEDVNNLVFRNNVSRTVVDGFGDVGLGFNNLNTGSTTSGGNIAIGQNNLNAITPSGTFSASPWFSTFRGDRNIGIGFNTGKALTGSGSNRATHNILMGSRVLETATDMSYNIFAGFQTAMSMVIPASSTNGQSNIGFGDYVMQLITGGTASYNVVIGSALVRNTRQMDSSNTFIGLAVGRDALYVGDDNTGIGDSAFREAAWTTINNNFNTAVGASAFRNIIEGSERSTAVGTSAGRFGGGIDNTYIGRAAGWSVRGTGNVSIGFQSGHVTNNIYTGSAGTPYIGTGSTFIGYRSGYPIASSGVSSVIVIGSNYQPTLVAGNTYINANNQLQLAITGNTKLTINNAGVLAYSLDVSNNYTNRSLVDKGYVTGITSSLQNKYTLKRIVTGDTTLDNNDFVIFCSGITAMTITLPASPVDGQVYKIKDVSGNALIDNIIVDGNGNNIDGDTDVIINTNRGAVELCYDSTLDSWQIMNFVN